MNTIFNKLIENFYGRDLDKIKEQLDTYITLCHRFNDLALAIGRAGFHYDDQNDIFDIAELFIAHCLEKHGITLKHIVDKIEVEPPQKEGR